MDVPCAGLKEALRDGRPEKLSFSFVSPHTFHYICGQLVTSYELPVLATGYELRVTSYELPMGGYKNFPKAATHRTRILSFVRTWLTLVARSL